MASGRSNVAGRKSQPELEIAEVLKREILFGRLRPRERLLEAELTERFGVGRYVVRAALDVLDRMGLVQKRANRGVIVRDYQAEDVDALYDMRRLLQTEAARRVALPSPPELIDELTRINARYAHHIEDGELTEAAEANDLFHKTLFGACGNRYLAELVEDYWLKTAAIHCYAIGVPSLARQSVEEHAHMIEILRSGTPEDLMRTAVDHMIPALKAYQAAHGGWGLAYGQV